MDPFRLIALGHEFFSNGSLNLSKWSVDSVLSVYILNPFTNERSYLKFNYDKSTNDLNIVGSYTTLLKSDSKVFINLYSLTLYRNKLINEIINEDDNLIL